MSVQGQPALATRLIMAWVGFVTRNALWTLALTAVLIALSMTAVVTRMGVTTDTRDMLSEDLPFRQADRALRTAFPDLASNIIVVVTGDTPALADQTAEALTTALVGDTVHFFAVTNFSGLEYFQTNALLMMSLADLDALADSAIPAQPFLGALWADPTFNGFADLLGTILAPPDGSEPANLDELAPVLRAMAQSARSDPNDPSPMAWQSLLSGKQEKPSDRRRFLLIQPNLNYASLAPAKEPIRAIRAAVASLETVQAGNAVVQLTGPAALAEEELASVQDGMNLAAIVSLILVTILLTMGLRSGRIILGTLAALVTGLTLTAGFAALSVATLNLISVSFAVLFIGLSVDFGIHFGLRYREERLHGRDNLDALQAAAEGTGGPLALAALAAAIAFLSFLPTDYIGLAQLGLISGAGMGIAVWTNLTVPPAIWALLPAAGAPVRPVEEGASGGGAHAERLPHGRSGALLFGFGRMLTMRPKVTIGIAITVAAVCVALLPQAKFDFDPMNLKDPNTESVSALLEILGDPGIDPYTIDILAPSVTDATAMADQLKTLDTVRSVISLPTLVPTNQEDKLFVVEDLAFALGPALSGEPGSLRPEDPIASLDALLAVSRQAATMEAEIGVEAAAAAAELADALETFPKDATAINGLNAAVISGLLDRLARLRLALDARAIDLPDLPEELVKRYVNPDGLARLEVLPRDNLRDLGALRDFVAEVRTVAPNAIGSPVVIAEAGNAVLRAFAEAATMAFIAIVILIYFATRSVRAIILIMGPIMLAGLLTVATTIVLAIPFNFANVIVLPLLVGLGVAGGIHVVGREKEEADINRAMASCTPRAILFSALTTIGSFGSIALSSHPGTASMGVLLTFSIALGLICTLGVLPAAMKLWPARSDSTAAAAV